MDSLFYLIRLYGYHVILINTHERYTPSAFANEITLSVNEFLFHHVTAYGAYYSPI